MKSDKQLGMLAAIGCYGFWGVIPVFYQWLDEVSPMEILAHRIIWAVVFLTALVWFRQRWSEFVFILKKPGLLGTLLLTSVLVSINWLLFIWAVMNERILETSLGYFLNPLVNIFLGVLFLSERLRKGQLLALVLAISGVLLQLLAFGSLPWVALTLALSFGGYGLLRKRADVDSVLGLFVETLILLPLALGYAIWLWQSQQLQFGEIGTGTDLLLVAGGLVTTVPLLLFTMAARRLPLSLMGFLQYLSPSISFGLAVWVYNEPVGQAQWITFGLIWLALLVFTLEGLFRQGSRVNGR